MSPSELVFLLAGPAEGAAWWVFAAPPMVMVSLLAVILYIARTAEAAPATERRATPSKEEPETVEAAPPRVTKKPEAVAKADAVPEVAAPEPEPKPEPKPKAEPKTKAPAVAAKLTAPKVPALKKVMGKPAATASRPVTQAHKPATKAEKPATKTEEKERPEAIAERTEPIAQPKAKPTAVEVAAPLARRDESEEKRRGDAEAPETKKKSLFEGLRATRGGFISALGDLFRGKKEVDDDLLDQLEEVMYGADLGVRTTERLLEELRSRLSRKELGEADAVWGFLRSATHEILEIEAQPLDISIARPFVFMVIGVNGVGKTTTIGKLGARYVDEGHKVLFAAGDTFRAAAVEQLEIWGERCGIEVVRGEEKADPSSVVFDAVKQAQKTDVDVVFCDTAGRLHTKVPLMEQMQKVRRVMDKAQTGAPHEVLLVLDATTGQNAIAQARMFLETLQVTGIALAKLDGTAKGGVVIGICDELKIPIRFIGIGEQIDDLRTFRPNDFVAALFADRESEAA